MSARTCLLVCFVAVWAIVIDAGCHSADGSEEQLAKTYCGSCHLFPDPSMLDKATWAKNILPAMGQKLGIYYFLDSPYEASKGNKATAQASSSQDAGISIADWKKIMDYYASNAPATTLSQSRPPVQQFTGLFTTKKASLNNGNSSVTYIKIDEGNKWVYAANAYDSSINIFDRQLHLLSSKNVHGVIVDMQFGTSMKAAGGRKGVLTNIGIMNPNDLKTGSVDSFVVAPNAAIEISVPILSQMPRPVQTTATDLDMDGLPDFLVCGFGNTNGALYWMKNLGNNQYRQNIIRALPGSIKAYINDFDHDGLPDIIALMAQSQEGIYLFTNKGNGSFDSRPLLQFPPVYGSSYFELDDFNNDGFKDILYTAGDNADYSHGVLKNYHGVYIFLNDGNNNFTQKYFFPINGCYKAIARDFDNDGDLDIATISFFPDYKNQPQEAFVYLENKGNSFFGNHFQFEPYTIHEFGEGNWLTMDAGDIDGDGDNDIVLGNFNPPGAAMQPAQTGNSKPSFLLLENNIIHH